MGKFNLIPTPDLPSLAAPIASEEALKFLFVPLSYQLIQKFPKVKILQLINFKLVKE